MTKKKFAAISLTVLAVMTISIIAVCVWTEVTNNPKYYTYEEHLQRVSDIAQKKVGENNYTVEPLYKENDEIFGFLVDYLLEGYGFDVVIIHNPSFISKVFNVSMYCNDYGFSQRYKIRDNETLIYENNIKWENTYEKELLIDRNGETPFRIGPYLYSDRLWEVNEKGNGIMYDATPYKLAGVDGEKKYLLKVIQNDRTGYIPAVKRGNKYLNLVSLEEFEYQEVTEKEQQPVIDLHFYTSKSYGNY